MFGERQSYPQTNGCLERRDERPGLGLGLELLD